MKTSVKIVLGIVILFIMALLLIPDTSKYNPLVVGTYYHDFEAADGGEYIVLWSDGAGAVYDDYADYYDDGMPYTVYGVTQHIKWCYYPKDSVIVMNIGGTRHDDIDVPYRNNGTIRYMGLIYHKIDSVVLTREEYKDIQEEYNDMLSN